MILPAFKKGSRLLGEIEADCLVAKVKNSQLPKVAFQWLAESKKDPVCEIYLRSSDTKQLSDWSKGILNNLFENECLSKAIEEGMKEYEATESWEPEYSSRIKKHGIASFLTVDAVVIDDIKREVILACDAEWDASLSEHKIAISLSDGHWHFNHGDYLSAYINSADNSEKEQSWEVARPPITNPEENGTDVSFIFGTWVFDEGESRALLERLKCSRREIEETVEIGKRIQYQFAQGVFRYSTGKQVFQNVEYVFIGCERQGEKVTIKHRQKHKEEVETQDFYYTNGLLMNLNGMALKKIQ